MTCRYCGTAGEAGDGGICPDCAPQCDWCGGDVVGEARYCSAACEDDATASEGAQDRDDEIAQFESWREVK